MKLFFKIFSLFFIVYATQILLISCNSQGDKNLVETEKENSNQVVDSFSILYSIGNQKLSSGDFKGAIPVFSKAIALNPNDPDAFYCRGYALSAIGKDSAAIIDYNSTIILKPDHKGAYFSRAVSYGVMGYFKEAITDYDKTLKLDSLFSNAWFNRGLIKLNSGQKEAGLKDIKVAARQGDSKALEFLK